MNAPRVGTSYLPQTDSGFNGSIRQNGPPVQLARLPRRRRPGMVALAVALVGAGVLASTAVYTATNTRVSVLVVTVQVPPGSVITSADLAAASVSAGPGVKLIPASQMRQVIGQIAGTALHPGMLLTASELTTLSPPAPGQVLVALPMRPSGVPASGLAPGDRVLVVATPGVQGQAGSSSGATALATPVGGVVVAASRGVNSDGFVVVDIVVAAADGPAVAQQASTGQFALIVTRRGG